MSLTPKRTAQTFSAVVGADHCRERLGAEDEQMSLTPKRTAQTFSAVVGADAVAPHAPLTRPRARQAPLSPRPAARAAEELEGAPAPPPGPPPGQHARGMKKS